MKSEVTSRKGPFCLKRYHAERHVTEPMKLARHQARRRGSNTSESGDLHTRAWFPGTYVASEHALRDEMRMDCRCTPDGAWLQVTGTLPWSQDAWMMVAASWVSALRALLCVEGSLQARWRSMCGSAKANRHHQASCILKGQEN